MAEDVDAVMAVARVLVTISAQSVTDAQEVVTTAQWRILAMVAGRGGLNLGAVAEGLGVHPSNATRAVDRLVVAGLVDRRDDPTDRRNLKLELTAAGHELVERVMSHRRAAITKIVEGMPRGRRQSLVPVLRAFSQAAGATADDAWSLGWPPVG